MTDEQTVTAAEHERCRATSERDWSALETLLDASLTHTHMNGRVDDRAALLANVRARPRTLRRGELHVRIFGDCAVMTGSQFLDLGAGEIENQVTETWIRQADGWRLVAFHASTDDPTPKEKT